MPEQRLHTSQVSPVIQQVGRETVAKLVWADIHRNAGKGVILFENIRDRPRGQAAPQLADEKRAVHDPGPVAIGMNRFRGHRPDRADSLLTALTEDPHALLMKIEVVDVEGGEFSESNA